VILEDPENENILCAGLYRGVYVSTDRGRNRSLSGPGMPAASDSDLVIQEREMDLIAATHGRGIYRTNIRAIQQAFKNGNPDINMLFDSPVARLPWINDTHRDRLASTAEKVPITFFLTKPAGVEIRIQNLQGKVIWSSTVAAQKGFNQVRWDLIVSRATSLQLFFFQYEVHADAGDYEVRISGDGVDFKGSSSIVERKTPDLQD
jgi:hypothetical protein